jgi:hypothetical protein
MSMPADTIATATARGSALSRQVVHIAMNVLCNYLAPAPASGKKMRGQTALRDWRARDCLVNLHSSRRVTK